MSEAADLPAWSLPAGAGDRIAIGVEWPERVTRDWAFGGATGKGVRVCILDSGVDQEHPGQNKRCFIVYESLRFSNLEPYGACGDPFNRNGGLS